MRSITIALEVQMPAPRKTSCRKLAEKGCNPLQTGESAEKASLHYQEGRIKWFRRRAPEPPPISFRRLHSRQNMLHEEWDVG